MTAWTRAWSALSVKRGALNAQSALLTNATLKNLKKFLKKLKEDPLYPATYLRLKRELQRLMRTVTRRTRKTRLFRL